MTDMYENNDDVPVDATKHTEAEVMIQIMTMKEQYSAFMMRGPAS